MTPPDPTRPAIAVLGAGAWGTALAVVIARNGFPVRLWGHHPDALREMRAAGENRGRLPGVAFPQNLELQTDLAALADSAHFLVAVPSSGFRETLQRLGDLAGVRERLSRSAILAWATKGIEPGSGRLLSDVAAEILGTDIRCGVITGPTFAGEVARGLPTVVCIGARQREVGLEIALWLQNDHTHVYLNPDITGVQLGAAIKNVIAIAVGISDGLGFGANARAALITRGLRELAALGVALGGRAETFMGLAATGDLILTCTDDQSRNRRLGIGLGLGKSREKVVAELGHEPEGVGTVRELYAVAQRLGVDMPITRQVRGVLFDGVEPRRVVEALLHHEPQEEELLLGGS
ncbi:MAG: NAD(P)-dependent glycerol-3-phosphate dehydrogenase [Gammaproteobacteria bacterium]|nr:NAD(P)-dependent glycerol-3-phosphate dehydrogenase [Gammaproteobacteria bacterium]